MNSWKQKQNVLSKKCNAYKKNAALPFFSFSDDFGWGVLAEFVTLIMSENYKRTILSDKA